MKLYVMRHGPADDDSPSGRDADRALTAAGRERVARGRQGAPREGRGAVHDPLEPARSRTRDRRDRRRGDPPLAACPRGRKGPPSGATGEVEIRRELGMGTEKLGLLAELVRAGRKRVMIVGPRARPLDARVRLSARSSSPAWSRRWSSGSSSTSDPGVAGARVPVRASASCSTRSRLSWQRD